MSVTKLLLSGLLVSSGLILAAFTLHSYFAAQGEVQATSRGESAREPQLAVPDEPSRLATSEATSDNWAPQLVRAEDQPAANGEAAKARKRLLEKKLAEKKQAQKKDKDKDKDKAKQDEPQTVFPWLLSLFKTNNTGTSK